MSNQTCSTKGCNEDADGVTPDDEQLCLFCADARHRKVTLYE